ncbi:MAG: cobalamin-binding protein [Spirochaetales bacterium]|nr:MAG: cobalamin-binding protein [Spirochaetales bacterium]
MDLNNITHSLIELEEDKVYEEVDKAIEAGSSGNDILKACQAGMAEIGNMYKREEAFIADMMYAGEILRNIMNKIKPLLEKEGGKREVLGKVIIGTVKGDIHDLGKDVVIIALEGNGFEVLDLGVDVEPEKFVEAIRSNKDAKVVGMSVFLTSAFISTSKTVAAIKEAGLRNNVRIMVGGAPVTDVVAKETGCDYFAESASAGVTYTKTVYGK